VCNSFLSLLLLLKKMADRKPQVLILGGLGFIGRNLIEYLADNNLVSKIRVADKVLPDLAGLSSKQSQIVKSDLVEFKQANLAREAMVNKVFDD
jgi:dTDP-D-glucose 4,6-dehydratase